MKKITVAALNESGITTIAGYKKIYNYRAETGEYTGSNDEYLPIGVGVPACSTLLPPPSCNEGQVAIFDIEKGDWTVEEDHRGEIVYSIKTGEPLEIKDIGPISKNFTTKKPSSGADEWDGENWVINYEKAKELAVKEAEGKKKNLLAEANTECNELMIDYNLGLLTEAQEEELKCWRIYIRNLKEVDTSTAPNIEWPELPNL
ncbi:tail fiber assembly protein [Salmonella enterica]|nr:tail fiber assembly protein [Salmonella enterica]EHK5999308.1 tail fiber assembly protein [Salmonella enterica]EIF5127486.1 tail fiber assembly protein [Salmonella enterica]EIF5348700.1 tail fiber assembly protein [Salmonella enterica]EIF5657297.1 tail fiber assembly protein [Salmonella enterica]